MTLKKFKKTILRANWYDKYFYYPLSIAVIFAGILFIYDRLENPNKYYSRSTHFFIFIAASFLIFLGTFALYKLPNRYKVLVFECNHSYDTKKLTVSRIMNEFGSTFSENENQIWSFLVKINRSRYNVWLTFDEKNIYASVILSTLFDDGFIDFGGTENYRKNLSTLINRFITELPATSGLAQA